MLASEPVPLSLRLITDSCLDTRGEGLAEVKPQESTDTFSCNNQTERQAFCSILQ